MSQYAQYGDNDTKNSELLYSRTTHTHIHTHNRMKVGEGVKCLRRLSCTKGMTVNSFASLPYCNIHQTIS
jgi:hypothetical protein